MSSFLKCTFLSFRRIGLFMNGLGKLKLIDPVADHNHTVYLKAYCPRKYDKLISLECNLYL